MILKERLQNAWQLAILPALRHMFGKHRKGSTVLLICAFFLVSAMLGVICLSYHANLTENDRLAADYKAYVTSSTSRIDDKETAAAVAAAADHILISKIELSAVFVFFMVIWGILSAFSLSRVFHATVERDKYVYGLYVTFGSDTRRIRQRIYLEFAIAALIALFFALPTAYLLTRGVYLRNGQDFHPGTAPLRQILLWLTAVSLLGAGFLARQITKSTCVELMEALDCSDYVSSPRISRPLGRRLYNGPLRYARLAIRRMRSYYIPLVLTVSVVAAVFFGSMNLALEGERAAGESVHEYTIEFSRGLTSDELSTGYLEHLMGVDDVQSVEALANDRAEMLGTHLLAEKSLFRVTEEEPPVDCGAYYATESIRIMCADGSTRAELGGDVVIPPEWQDKAFFIDTTYNYSRIPEAGSAVYFYPEERPAELNISVGDTLQIAIPRSGNEGKTLEEKLDDGMYEYISVTVSAVVEIPGVRYVTLNEAEYVCPRITEDHLMLSPEDYATVSQSETVETLALDELYREDLRFGTLKAPAVLLLPEDYSGPEITTVQMFQPMSQVTEQYAVSDPLDSHTKIYLNSDRFCINRTAYHTYFYLGTAGSYSNDSAALDRMMQIEGTSLSKYEQLELTVVDRLFCADLTEPCLVLPNDGFLSSYDGDLCVLQLRPDGALYATREELFLFSTEQPLRQAEYVGKRLFSHTEIEAGFFDEMKAQGLYTTYPNESAYELSTFHILSLFELDGMSCFLVRLSPYCNLGMDNYPAYMVPGRDFIFLGGLDVKTDLPLSAADSYLRFEGKAYRRGSTLPTSLVGEFYATNDLTVSVADGINIGLLSPGLEIPSPDTNEAVLVLGRDSILNVSPGDYIQMALQGEFYLDPNDPQVAALTGNDLLRYIMERRISFRYISLRVTDVIRGEGEEDILYLSESAWQRIRRTDSTYQALDIYLFSDTDLVSLVKTSARIRALMGNWQGGENRVTLVDHNRLWQTVTTGACNYPAIIRTLSILLILLLPLLWCAPQTMHFHKRREEFSVMHAVGRTRGQLRRMIAGECLLITLAAGVFVALLCPFSVACIIAAIATLELPFETADYDMRAYLFMIAFVMLCSAASFLTAARHLTDAAPGGSTPTKGDHTP